MSEQKIRSICVDTLTAIQENLFMEYEKKPGHDKWMDWGKSIWNFNSDLQKLGFETILILGEPGVGKSTGMRTLPHNSNIWYNADRKNPVWTGGKTEYGKKTSPRAPYHVIPKSYSDIINHIKQGLSKDMFEEERYAILTAHVEPYKQGNDIRYRLKTLGNLATKMQIEGKYETVLHAKVMKEGENIKYIFETQNDGFNTVRSPMGVFDATIDNDYDYVLNKLTDY